MCHSLHSTEVHVYFFTCTKWNLLLFITTTFRMAGYVSFRNSAFHLQRMPKSSIQFLNGNKKWPHILPDSSLLCRILTNLQFHSVSAKKCDIIYLLDCFPMLVSITVILPYYGEKQRRLFERKVLQSNVNWQVEIIYTYNESSRKINLTSLLLLCVKNYYHRIYFLRQQSQDVCGQGRMHTDACKHICTIFPRF